MHKISRVAVAVALSVSASTPLQAQMPTVQQVFDKYATAVGGRDAWAKVSDRSEVGSANLAFANLTAAYERHYSAPNKFIMVMDLGQYGKVQQATDGTTAWMMQPGAPATKLPPEDAAYLNEASATGAAFLDPARFSKAAVVGKEQFDGVDCYKLELTTKAGRARTDFYEVSTGLRRGYTLNSPAGPQKTVLRDYKAFEGKMVPTTIVQTNGQGDIVITISSVTFAPNDAKLFAVPPGVTP